MKRSFGLALLGLTLALTALAQVPSGGLANGNWQLTTLAAVGSTENTSWLLKIDTADGKTTATLAQDSAPAKGKGKGKGKAKQELVSFDQVGDKVRVVVKSTTEQVFEGRVSKNGKRIFGVMGNAQSASAAYMAPTEMEVLPKGVQRLGLTLEELKDLAAIANTLAKGRSPTATAEVNSQIAAAFLAKKNTALAAVAALAAEKALSDRSPTDLQVKVLQTATRALKEAGKGEELKPVAARLEKLEKGLDVQYKATVPPFQGKMFAGRNSQSQRVALMELFTGAQCAPCVAADVAFDVLQRNYKPTELVLIQYHLHIPGPDPMTNSDTEARAKFYRVNATPTTVFNGSEKIVGGGAMAAAEKTYEKYCQAIDPALEEPAGCKIVTWAKRQGDKIEIHTDVAGVAKPGKDIKLRLVLVEENIRFVGSNNLRLHHQVVRAMPGGVNGVAVVNPVLSTKNEVDLTALRKQLTRYLDVYDAASRPFPQISRPLDLRGLRVIALVQDDSTKDILQAVQVNVIE